MLLVAGAALALPGCSRGDRVEATAHWLGADFAFGAGIAFTSPDGLLATVGFFPEPLPAATIEEVRRMRSVVQALARRTAPFLVLELRLKAPGKAGFDNLVRYSVLFANMGGTPVTFNRQSRDWVKDGGIELAGDARVGARLLGRVRRAGATDIEGTEQPYRWDLGFDTSVAA
ncbi:MAG: hypothetical protein ING77_19405 [Rhodocyclaceae bacterium]|jgi:hypothetical protein|nr:hypothetical protein [Rhodocyclaceae bacterium]MCE2980666.1 hypothetical protein [Betaproteobacteria bacterium]MCA3074385.1 hypothetical protein [Rhodocyclaceae bacterium]MCA3090792.1 hypothetical protein [Rhodocyclaceae bacterium]MCA3095529.1 hypothetical protein [Rhodocyclaceae bacterium]